VIFIAFLATALIVREAPRPALAAKDRPKGGWSQMPRKKVVAAMLGTGLLLMLANLSIEPIITVYVGTLVDDRASARAGLLSHQASAITPSASSRLPRPKQTLHLRRVQRVRYDDSTHRLALGAEV
jgi:hypothetical protein